MDLFNTITSNRFWNKHGVNLAWGLAALALFLVFATAGWTEFRNYQGRQLDYAPQALAPINQNQGRAYRVSDIVGANLFGDARPVPKVTKAPKTTLNLTLEGILWASDPQFARVIIGSGSKSGQLYSVGDSIQGAGASIKEIKENEVLLNRNGATESLPLLKKTSSGNRSIITFSNPDAENPAIGRSVVSNTDVQARSAANQQEATIRRRAENGAPRKVRRPNFSGLDKALKKMGEL